MVVPVVDDGLLNAWLRHYLTVLILVPILGAAGAYLYTEANSQSAQAWSIVVETQTRIQARQLGPVAETVFRSSAVYRPVFDELGIVEAPPRFFDDHAELRPVPQTGALIVVGKAATLDRAETISNAMARSLVAVFNARVGGGFQVFSSAQPAPVSTSLSRSVAVVLGGAVGLWLALALAVLHYRSRRPVLTLERALSLTGAAIVRIVPGASWARPSVLARAAARARFWSRAGTTAPEGSPNGHRLAEPTAMTVLDRPDGALQVVCDANTSAVELAVVPRSEEAVGRPVEVVWGARGRGVARRTRPLRLSG